jgi:hypothetical protein
LGTGREHDTDNTRHLLTDVLLAISSSETLPSERFPEVYSSHEDAFEGASELAIGLLAFGLTILRFKTNFGVSAN